MRKSILAFVAGAFAFTLVMGIRNTRSKRDAWVYNQWSAIKNCSRVNEISGGHLSDVVWVVVPNHSMDTHAKRTIGLYGHDTIWIDSLYYDSAFFIQHELLHHLLHDTSVVGSEEQAHPFFPFTFPCQLATFQHYGSIMHNAPVDTSRKDWWLPGGHP